MTLITVSARAVAKALGLAIGILVLLNTLGLIAEFYLGYNYAFGFVPRFSLEYESNVPTWYACITLLVCAVLLAVIAVDPRSARWRRHWLVLAAGFAYLSVDEMAQLHELIGPLIEARVDVDGLLRFSWVIPGIVGAVLLAIAYRPFLAALPARSRNLFVLAGMLYLGGALGVEAITGWRFDEHGKDFVYMLLSTVEETLEMIGVAIFIYALVHHLNAQGVALRIAFAAGAEPAAAPAASVAEAEQPADQRAGN